MGQILRFQKRQVLLSDKQPPAWQARGSRISLRGISIKALLLSVIIGAVGAEVAWEYSKGTLQWVNLQSAVSSVSAPFGLCGGWKRDCVIDGATIDYQGQRIRMVDYDAPEIGEPKCPYERQLGHRAKWRLLDILNSGPVAVTPRGDRDVDQYGRKLRMVTVRGFSVGDYLIGEGLAVPWEGHRHYWCG